MLLSIYHKPHMDLYILLLFKDELIRSEHLHFEPELLYKWLCSLFSSFIRASISSRDVFGGMSMETVNNYI